MFMVPANDKDRLSKAPVGEAGVSFFGVSVPPRRKDFRNSYHTESGQSVHPAGQCGDRGKGIYHSTLPRTRKINILESWGPHQLGQLISLDWTPEWRLLNTVFPQGPGEARDLPS